MSGIESTQDQSLQQDNTQDQELFESQIDHPVILSSIKQQKEQESLNVDGNANVESNQAVSSQDQDPNNENISQKIEETIKEPLEENKKPNEAVIIEELDQQSVLEAEKKRKNSEEAYLASIDQKHRQILQQGNTLKEEAKLLVKRKEYSEAIKLYEKSRQLLHIDNFEREHFSKVAKEYTELNVMLLCNLSLCFYELGDYERSLQHGEKVALMDPNHLKASYRRAMALKKLGRLDKAFDEIRNARLISIGKQQIDEQVNKEYRIIKEAYMLTKSSSVISLNSSCVPQPKQKVNNELTSSSQSSLAVFLDNNLTTNRKTTPYYALCSAISSFVVLKRFMNIDLVTKPALIAGPILTLSMFGFLQGKHPLFKAVCGALIGIVSAILYRFAALGGPKSITN